MYGGEFGSQSQLYACAEGREENYRVELHDRGENEFEAATDDLIRSLGTAIFSPAGPCFTRAILLYSIEQGAGVDTVSPLSL